MPVISVQLDERQIGHGINGTFKYTQSFVAPGLFEQCHHLMSIEEALMAFYEYPDEMHELIDYITEYRLKYAKLLIDKLQPDAILSHDDWGAKKSLFMSPEMWREFFKEPYRKIYQYIRSRGVIAIQHADSYLAPIVEDTRKKLEGVAKSDEDVLSYIAFPNLAEKFFEDRKAKEENVVTYSIVEA